MEITELLRSKPEDTKITVKSFLWKGSEAELVLEVQPWWNTKEVNSQIGLKITGVKEASFAVGATQKNNTIFALLDNHPLVWDYGQFYLIYGKAPLPDPYRFYWEFSDFLKCNIKTPRAPEFYFNMTGTLKAWATMCYQRAFYMMSVPEQLLADLADMFYSQAFEYTVLKDEKRQITQGQKVLFCGDCWIVCDDVRIGIV